MTVSREVTQPCGCVSVWSDLEGQYHRKHSCPEHTEKKERIRRRIAMQKSHDESKRRGDAPLYRKPFSLLK